MFCVLLYNFTPTPPTTNNDEAIPYTLAIHVT